VISNKLDILVREGCTGLQQSALFAPQNRAGFSHEAIPRRSFMQECMSWSGVSYRMQYAIMYRLQINNQTSAHAWKMVNYWSDNSGQPLS